MTQKLDGGAVPANLAVPIGCLLVITAFFLPWLRVDTVGVSGLGLLRQRFFQPAAAVVLAFLVLATGRAVPRQIVMRLSSRLTIVVAGAIMAGTFGFYSVTLGQLAGPGLWLSFAGGLLIVVGTVFDLIRGA